MGDIEEIVLTPGGYKELADELESLRTTERREVAERIRDAITYGELTENSEYEDAKNAQAFLEGRIEDLKHIMQIARPAGRGRDSDRPGGAGVCGHGQRRRL